jgi:hypothetical protein
MEGKELHTDQFQIKSVFFQNSTYIQPALTTASGQQVNSFQKKELAGIYIYWESTSSCSYQKWQKPVLNLETGFSKNQTGKKYLP